MISQHLGRSLFAGFCFLVATGAANWGHAVALVWNDGTGSFVGSPTWSYDDAGTVVTTDNPFDLVGVAGGLGGENLVLIGNDGDVTLSASGQGPFADNSIYELRIGTLAPEADLSGVTGGANYQGNGTLTVDGVGLILFNDGVGSGNLIVGGANGISGTLNWNSSQTLVANNQLRVGQGGTGTFNQNGGAVEISTVTGPSDFARVGTGGGTGVYNLNDGSLQIGSADGGDGGLEKVVVTGIGIDGGSMGTFNLGDGSGSTGSSTVETWANLTIGGGGGTGELNVASDGALTVNYAPGIGSSSGIRIGNQGGSSGALVQSGGTIATDGLMSMGFNTGKASYTLNGSGGSTSVRAFEAFQLVDINFNLDAGGATTIQVAGGTNTAGDVGAGNSITLSSPTLNITGLDSYASLADIVLFDQLDPSASLTGTFGNFTQGQVVGQNAGGNDFYLNLFGGTGNDIVLQSTLPSSSTIGLVWNTGVANFDAGWASGDGSFGVAVMGIDPFSGPQSLYLGNGGVATFDDTTNTSSGTTVQNIFIGTNKAGAVVAGRNGDGTLTVNGSQSLTIDDAGAAGAEGFFTVGEQGFTGTVNWNSTGTLDAQGQFRVGRDGGTGVFNQTAGIVQGGTTGGGGKYLAIGDGAGSTGTYNLAGGALYPDGQGPGSPRRQFRIGHAGATGTLNIGDGTGAAESAILETEDDLWVGAAQGDGTLTIESDGAVRLLTNDAPMFVGYLASGNGGTGRVVQNGGSLVVDGVLSVGQGNGSVGEYQFNGGSITTANDGVDDFRVGGGGGNGSFLHAGGTLTSNSLFTIGQAAGSVGEYTMTGGVVLAANDGTGDIRVGGGGGNGTLRISGTANFSSQSTMIIAEAAGQGTTGLLEITGSQATVTLDRLANPPGMNGPGNGNDETIRWVADAGGVTPITILGASGTNVLQLQDPQEVEVNTGTNGLGDLMGDGTALELNLSALSGSQVLTLFDNQSTEDVIGFFENGSTMDLYEEGEAILGTGYGGTVTISYVGGTGNDVVLSLVASGGLLGDFNGDSIVNIADYTLWRNHLGAADESGISNNGDGGGVTVADYQLWKDNFGATAGALSTAAANVPEPQSLLLVGAAICMVGSTVRRRQIC